MCLLGRDVKCAGSSTSLAGLASSTSSPGAGSSSPLALAISEEKSLAGMAEPEASTQPATTTEIAWTFEPRRAFLVA